MNGSPGSPKKLSPQMERVSNDLRLERKINARNRTDPPQQPVAIDTSAKERRRALSGVDSPRAPHENMEWSPPTSGEYDSSLPPLEDMLDSSTTPTPSPTDPKPRDRRRALSNNDSPRAPGVALATTVIQDPATPDSLAPISEFMDTPRTSARFVAMNQQSNQAANPPAHQDPPAGSRRKALSGMNSPRAPSQGHQAPPDSLSSTAPHTISIDHPTLPAEAPHHRRKALSGNNSPRAPNQQQHNTAPESPGLAPLSEMLDTPRSHKRYIAEAQTRRPAALTMPSNSSTCSGVSNRRKALSGTYSPRAPQVQTQLDLQPGDLDDLGEVCIPTSPETPLPPVSDMLDTPRTAASFRQHQTLAPSGAVVMGARRAALSGPDSPRAPTLQYERQSVPSPDSPLVPLSEMLIESPVSLPSNVYTAEVVSSPGINKGPHSSSPGEETVDLRFIQQRLADAEDANMQWAEYCVVLQHQNSSLLEKISALQQQNAQLRGVAHRQDEYRAALSPDFADSPSPVSNQACPQDMLLRRNALSGRDSPRAPNMPLNSPDRSPRCSMELPRPWSIAHNSAFEPGGTSRAWSPSPEEEAQTQVASRTVMPSSPLLQRLLRSSPGSSNRSDEYTSVDVQNSALERLVDALEAYEDMTRDPAVLQTLQDRLQQRNQENSRSSSNS